MDFNSLLIGSEDPDRLVEYYKKVFGEPTMSMGGYTGWQVGSGFVTVGPHSEVKGKNDAPGRIIWNIETKDVAGEFARIKAAGGIVVAEPYGYQGEERVEPSEQVSADIATFADPDGNYFQLMSPMDPSQM